MDQMDSVQRGGAKEMSKPKLIHIVSEAYIKKKKKKKKQKKNKNTLCFVNDYLRW
jgi:hypothetical protein